MGIGRMHVGSFASMCVDKGPWSLHDTPPLRDTPCLSSYCGQHAVFRGVCSYMNSCQGQALSGSSHVMSSTKMLPSALLTYNILDVLMFGP